MRGLAPTLPRCSNRTDAPWELVCDCVPGYLVRCWRPSNVMRPMAYVRWIVRGCRSFKKQTFTNSPVVAGSSRVIAHSWVIDLQHPCPTPAPTRRQARADFRKPEPKPGQENTLQ